MAITVISAQFSVVNSITVSTITTVVHSHGMKNTFSSQTCQENCQQDERARHVRVRYVSNYMDRANTKGALAGLTKRWLLGKISFCSFPSIFDQPPRRAKRASFEPGRMSTSSEQCPLTLISRSFNCAINPGLGHTTDLARTSSPSASFNDIEHLEIR